MNEQIGVYIAGINCTYEEAIRQASKGSKVVILYDDELKIELINFKQNEAKEFYSCIDNITDNKVKLISNYI